MHTLKDIYCHNRIKQGNMYTVPSFKILNQYFFKTPVMNVVQITKICSFQYQNILHYFGLKLSKIFHSLPKVKQWNDG